MSIKNDIYEVGKCLKQKIDFETGLIEEAIVFRPNENEFTDPLTYINQIRSIGEKYGVVKIVPPKYWKPTFCLDMNSFKFTPRIQRLNELEAGSRIKLNFLEKLSKFWELQGQKFRIPILERKQVDLYKLNKLVESMGGYESIVKNKRWTKLMKEMGFKESSSAHTLKNHYEKILYPHLLFETGVSLPINPKRPSLNRSMSNQSTTNTDDDGGGGYDEELKEEQEEPKGNPSKKKKYDKMVLDEEKIESIQCLVCNRGDDEAFILLCDGCDDSYHTYCLYPPLMEIPKGDWRCPLCVAEICKKPTDLYGFEQSTRTYNLNEFGEMANKFKTDYFKKSHNLVTPEEIEKEFWNILSSPDETVTVEYGADLHTLETGSGFPTLDYKGKLTSTNEDYINSPWNLNNLSKLEKSVLSQMNVEISGMKIPWAYVGMCFSCFCWHVEDHWSYSINYLHWGGTKTWYGVSGLDADKFEKEMKENAPELFERSPDLLHHLVTIMNPAVLKKNGVPIYKVNQNAGEFVVTFPRAYHAGFNQGFNFAEAVNFCPADWMPLGRAAIENYKLVKRHTVFSHDELVCKVATNKTLRDLTTIIELQKEIDIIIDIEKSNRDSLMDKGGIKNIRKVAFELLSDDERTCEYCKTTCFVSAVSCSCSPNKLVCLNHSQYLCKVNNNMKSNTKTTKNTHRQTLLYRYAIDELYEIKTRLKLYSDEYRAWCKTVESILNMRYKDDEKIKNNNNNDDDNGNNECEVEVIDLENETSNYKKPHISKVLRLLEQAKLKNYPKLSLNNYLRFKSSSSSSSSSSSTSSSSSLSLSSEIFKRESLFNELEYEFKNALQCAEMCKKILDSYKKSKSKQDDEDDGSDDDDRVDSDGNKLNEIKNEKNEMANDNDEDIIILETKTPARNKLPFRKRLSLQQIKALLKNLNKLVCEIDEQNLLELVIKEALDYEQTLESLIQEWITDSPSHLKRVLDYLNKIDIEFPFLQIEQLKVMYKQAKWLNKVNRSIENPSCLTVDLIYNLIDEVMEESLLITFNSNTRSKLAVEKTLVDLQELLSIAQTWDKKAKSQIESKSPLKLEELEQTLAEAKCIPAYMENVEKLDQIVNESNKWVSNVETYLKDPKCLPYLNDLVDSFNQVLKLPVKLKQAQTIQIKIESTYEWTIKLNNLLNLVKINSIPSANETIDTTSLLQILTPRLDLKSILNKLQATISNSTSSNSQLSSNNSNENKSSVKRMKLKSNSSSTNLSANVNSSSTSSSNNTSNTSSANLSQQQQELFVNKTENAYEIYNQEKDISNLKETIKLLEIREVELIKQIRSINQEKLDKLSSQLITETNTNHTSGSGSSSGGNLIGAGGIGSQSAETNSNEINNLKITKSMNVKCCSCHKSIASSLISNNVQQCKLCLGLFHFHNTCKNLHSVKSNVESKSNKHSTTINEYLKEELKPTQLCFSCKRSKRPNLDQILEMLIMFDKLEIRSDEGNALQMFVNRILNWQEKYKTHFESSSQLKEVDVLLRKLSNRAITIESDKVSYENCLNELKKAYNGLSCLKKAELNDLNLESLLLEIEIDEIKLINDLFNLINCDDIGSSDDRLGILKPKLKKTNVDLSVGPVLSSNDNNINSNNPNESKLKKHTKNKSTKNITNNNNTTNNGINNSTQNVSNSTTTITTTTTTTSNNTTNNKNYTLNSKKIKLISHSLKSTKSPSSNNLISEIRNFKIKNFNKNKKNLFNQNNTKNSNQNNTNTKTNESANLTNNNNNNHNNNNDQSNSSTNSKSKKSTQNNSNSSSNNNIKKEKQEAITLQSMIVTQESYDMDSDDSNEEFCAASDCIQPAGDNIKWVQCDGYCDRWFHMVCVGLTKIRKKEKYLCNTCGEQKIKEFELKPSPDKDSSKHQQQQIKQETDVMMMMIIDSTNNEKNEPPSSSSSSSTSTSSSSSSSSTIISSELTTTATESNS